MKKICFLLIAMLLSASAFSGQVTNGKILRIMVNTQVGTDMLFIQVSGDLTDSPMCSTNGVWQFVLPLSNELQKDTVTSFLLSAYMSGALVRIDGSGTCDTFGSIETMTRFEFLGG